MGNIKQSIEKTNKNYLFKTAGGRLALSLYVLLQTTCVYCVMGDMAMHNVKPAHTFCQLRAF